jgi:hypothetical protein
MSEKQNKKSKFELTEQMLVIVNKDWSRTYVASIRTIEAEEGIKRFSAKCELKYSSIVTIASDKNQLSTNMDEMATIIEDCVSGENPVDTPVIAGTNCCLN